MTMEKESTSCLNKMSILTFSYPILLRDMTTKSSIFSSVKIGRAHV